MLELIISYFLTKFNIITKKPNNPDCHLNHSVSTEEPNGLDAVDLNENNNAFVSINRNAVGTIFNLYIP